MQTIKVSATKARQDFFELLNLMVLGQTQVLIEKDSEPVAILTPRKKAVDWVGLKKAMDAAHGILKDFDLEKSPLRGRKSKAWLAKAREF